MAEALEETVVLTDPRAIRAIAHPARMVVIDALYDQGRSLTATQAAELAGITPSAMSYHLRALERFGLVKRATTSGDARERPWTRTAKNVSIRPSAAGNSTAAAAATGAVLTAAMEFSRERLLSAMRRLSSETDRLPLDEVVEYNHTSLLVTPNEAKHVLRQLDGILEPYRLESRVDVPEEAGHLTVTITAIPDPDHPGGTPPDPQRS